MSQYPGQYSPQMNQQQNVNLGSGQPTYNTQGAMGQNPWGSPNYAPTQNLQASNMNYGQGQGNYQAGPQIASPQYQTFNPAQSQQSYPQIQTGYLGMPAQNQPMPAIQGMQQQMLPQSPSMPNMMTNANAMPVMMPQNMPQGQIIQQGQAVPLMASQLGHDNIPMGQPIDHKHIPTGLAGNRDREWLLQYGNPNPDEMFLLREWFGTVDQDKTGQIDVVKLQTALSASGEKFGENICFLLIKMFDVDGSQSINFIEFAQLYKFIRSMRAAFEAVDINRSNLINLAQLQQALGAAGFNNIPPQYATLLFRKFDRNKRQKLSFENFMELCVILGHTKSWFIAKDTYFDGKVTLTLFELFELVSYC